MPRNLPLIGILCIWIAALGREGIAQPAGKELVYKQLHARDLHIYVTKPTDWKPSDARPAIVFFHGGGWVGGSPGQFSSHAAYFASRGLVCFQVEYRLLDKKKKDPPETCIQDATDAFRWIRSRSTEFGIQPDRIASAGGSAGGNLAAYLGCIVTNGDNANEASAKSNAMLLFNPVYDNGPGGWGTARVGDEYPKYSPMHNITKDDPPSIVFLGTEDKLIPVKTGKKFQQEFSKLGIQSELVLYEGQGHGFFNTQRQNGKFYYETVKAADGFLVELGWLTGTATIEPPNPAKNEKESEPASSRTDKSS